jgi:AmiR/NasT family two-component response regulator
VFVAHAATSLANATAFSAARVLSEQLQEALESRAVIEQAKGILMARHGIDADRAFEQLREQSQHSNRKVRDLAADVVQDAVTPAAAAGG